MPLSFNVTQFYANVTIVGEINEDYGDAGAVKITAYGVMPSSSSYETAGRVLSARFGLKNAHDYEPYIAVNPNGVIIIDGRCENLEVFGDDSITLTLTAELFGNKYESNAFSPYEDYAVGSGIWGLTFTKVNS